MMTMLENLSNEILMELFEYLDAYQLSKTFFNLNSRFNQLLKDHRLCLTFNSKHIRENKIIDYLDMIKYLKAIILVKDKHIRMLMSVCKENDLAGLQSLILYRVRLQAEKSAVVKFISNLKSLRKLHVQALGEIHDLVLMVIFCNELPELKSFECTTLDYDNTVLFNGPIPSNIENLTIDCSLYNLTNLLVQTPKLKYLNVTLINYGLEPSVLTDSSTMMSLIHLKMNIYFVSYNNLSDIVKSMPHLKIIELSGESTGQNLDNGHQLKQLFGHLSKVQLKNVACLMAASSTDAVLATFNDEINGFWSNVTCSIGFRNRVHITATGRAR